MAKMFAHELTRHASNNPDSIIVCDEIEKSHPEIINIFLSVLDNGELVNENGKRVSFVNTYIFVTSNIGAEILQEFNLVGATDSAEENAETLDKLKRLFQSHATHMKDNGFKAEHFGRFDDLIIFNPLKGDSIRKIVYLNLESIVKQNFKVNNTFVHTEGDDRLMEFLAVDLRPKSTSDGGARELKRNLAKHVKKPLAYAVQQRKLYRRELERHGFEPLETDFLLRVEGELLRENLQIATSKASIVVEHVERVYLDGSEIGYNVIDQDIIMNPLDYYHTPTDE